MRSIVYEENGPASVLRLVEREPDEPGPGEVRVRVVVSGVNPTDWKSRAGSTRTSSGPSVPNQDGAGVVDAVGPDVSGLAVGDRVWLSMAAFAAPMGGSAQELTVLRAARVHPLPEGVGFDVGASLGVPAITAHRALTVSEGWPERLAPGSLAGATVLVAGGAGAVGHAAIQLARWAGATVIATVSGDEKARLATAAGAHHIVNYREDGAAERIRGIAPDGVDTIVEVAIAQNADLDAAVLKPGGTVAIYAANPGDEYQVDIRALMSLNARLQFVLLYTVPEAAIATAVEDVTEALDALPVGEAAGLPLHRFPLEETAAAHDAVEAGAVGKVLIDVAPGA
ncbi:NADPH:quinone reductase [Pseudolysinimonas sp.]|uniref:NADPH:quinone reductase n=1 Tax=Pseudolysinimonas sp. TaxID=2680009 RepID=UPI003F7D405C